MDELDAPFRALLDAKQHADTAPLTALHALTILHATVEPARVALIARAREQGASWADIARPLGMTRQAAHEKYGRSVGMEPPTDATIRPHLHDQHGVRNPLALDLEDAWARHDALHATPSGSAGKPAHVHAREESRP